MTSNVHESGAPRSAPASPRATGGALGPDLERRLLGELRKAFRPEFLNRVDEIIVFEPLQKEQLAQIVDLLMARVRSLVEGQGMSLRVTDAAKARVLDEGYDVEFGARPLRRAIQRLIENPLSSELLRGRFGEGDTIVVDAVDGALTFSKA